MIVTIKDRGEHLREKLQPRLQDAERLLCVEHGQPVTAVTINSRENGWFDARWTTCCDRLEKQAAEILKHRC